jgi:hypothetical protein
VRALLFLVLFVIASVAQKGAQEKKGAKTKG